MKNMSLREENLLETLAQKRQLSIREIATLLNISEPTARRLCTKLASAGKVLRTYGGISCISKSETDYLFDALQYEFIEEKRRIGEYASTLFSDNEIIFIESGTTLQQLSIAIARRIADGNLKNLTVFTNSLSNLNIFSPHCEISLIGGTYRPKRHDFSGYLCEKTIRSLHFNRCFLGADGIDSRDGVMALDIDTARIDELLITRSDVSYVLVDHSKFLRSSLISYGALRDVKIITDRSLPESIRAECEAHGSSVTCV